MFMLSLWIVFCDNVSTTYPKGEGLGGKVIFFARGKELYFDCVEVIFSLRKVIFHAMREVILSRDAR